MNGIDDFLALVRGELGLNVAREDLDHGLDEIPGWDSLHLLWLVSLLERETGRSVSLPEVLEAPSLNALYKVVAGA